VTTTTRAWRAGRRPDAVSFTAYGQSAEALATEVEDHMTDLGLDPDEYTYVVSAEKDTYTVPSPLNRRAGLARGGGAWRADVRAKLDWSARQAYR
jgi:hypothetical protein